MLMWTISFGHHAQSVNSKCLVQTTIGTGVTEMMCHGIVALIFPFSCHKEVFHEAKPKRASILPIGISL